MKNFQNIVIIFFILIGNLCFSQEDCDFMFNAIESDSKIYVSSEVDEEPFDEISTPIISKLNSDGSLAWRTLPELPQGYTGVDFIDLFDSKENFIYTIAYMEDLDIVVWKLDKTTGQVIWQSEVFDSDFSGRPGIIDYNEDKIVLYTSIDDFNGGTISGFRVYTLNKSNGDNNLIHEDERNLPSIKMAMDSQGNIFYSYYTSVNGLNDEAIPVIRKINGLNFNNIIWEKDYIDNFNDTPSLDRIDNLFISNINEVFAMSSESGNDLFKIDGRDGSKIWGLNNIGAFDRRLTDYKFRDGKLYMSFQHIYVGGSTANFEMSKVDTETGLKDWTTSQASMDVLGGIDFANGNKQAIYSFDFDCSGDIYATGYYGTSGYGPGAMGIMKIDGMDGTKVNDITVTLFPDEVDEYSSGIKSFVINDNPIFLGNVETEEYESKRVFVTTDLQLNSINTTLDYCNLLSVNEYTIHNTIHIYPNPTDGILNIETEKTITGIEVYNIAGQLVYNLNNYPNIVRINVSSLNYGLYFLRFYDDLGTSYHLKFIKN